MTDLTEFLAFNAGKKTVAVQGLGFVGGAMVAALSNTKDKKTDEPLYAVLGVDLSSPEGLDKINSVNEGRAPITSSDPAMPIAFKKAKQQGNVLATADMSAFLYADIVVIDIPFDVKKVNDSYDVKLDLFLSSVSDLARNINPSALVVVETTVPPGMTEGYLHAIFMKEFKERGVDCTKFALAHSYERVMPGANYLSSITDYYRVYAGFDNSSSQRAQDFLESFINTKDFPLTRLHKPAASEMAKVLENSYRALNIAFIQEWTEFAEATEVDLFSVLDAIRMRPTHQNIMSPGFGVGGYCLTKDALLADWASQEAHSKGLPLSKEGIRINDIMPLHTLKLLKEKYGDLKQKFITLLGVSYLNDVADTRYTPSEIFCKELEKEGAVIQLHDPYVTEWPVQSQKISNDLNDFKSLRHDILILAVRHKLYCDLSVSSILSYFPNVSCIVDANNILDENKASELRNHGVKVVGVGKGHWNS